MDRDTLEGDLDLILGPQPNAEPVGEWDWEPPLGTTVPTVSSAHEPEGARDGRRGRLRGVGRRGRRGRGRLSFPDSAEGGGGPGRPLLPRPGPSNA